MAQLKPWQKELGVIDVPAGVRPFILVDKAGKGVIIGTDTNDARWKTDKQKRDADRKKNRADRKERRENKRKTAEAKRLALITSRAAAKLVKVSNSKLSKEQKRQTRLLAEKLANESRQKQIDKELKK